jgi:TetR/AcrR family transcriptional repressor of nem operon
VLDNYFNQVRGVIAQTLADQSRKPIEHLPGYFERITDLFGVAGWCYGCLAGDVGLESPERGEIIRAI